MVGKLQREVDHGIRERIHTFMHVPGGFKRVTALEDNRQIESVVQIGQLAESLREQRNAGVIIRQNPLSRRWYVLKSAFVTLIVRWLETRPEDIHQYFPLHQIHPAIQIMLEHIPVFEQHLSWLNSANPLMTDPLRNAINGFNEGLRLLGERLAETAVINDGGDFTRNANKNRLSLKRYTEALIAEYGPLDAVRLDLGYLDRITYSARYVPQVSYEQTEQHRKLLLNFLRRQSASSPVGYAWKLQHSYTTSYRYHLVLLFRHTAIGHHEMVGDQIGRHWTRVITAGKGGYFNWNTPDGEYERHGTGYVRTPIDLKAVVEYLTRLDRYMKLTLPVKGRSFDKGNMPKGQ